MYAHVKSAIVFLLASLFLFQSIAAPLIVFGPQRFNAGLFQAKKYSVSFAGPSSLNSNDTVDAIISIQNGDGTDLVLSEKCKSSNLSRRDRIECQLESLYLQWKLFLDRPFESEIKLNGSTILAEHEMPRTLGKLQKVIKIKKQNNMIVEIKGLPTSSINLKVETNSVAQNLPPVALFSATPTTALGDLKVSFDGSASSDSDGIIVNYTWDFGDGVILSSGTTNGIDHIYAQPGNYRVTLTVTDNQSAQNSTFRDISVVDNIAPIVTITSPIEATIFNGLTSVQINITGVANEKLSSATVQVDNGVSLPLLLSSDGLNFSGNISITSSGSKVLIFSSNDIAGNITTNIVNTVVNLNLPPLANFSMNPTVGIAPEFVSFSGLLSSDLDGIITKYEWNFGDGSGATGALVNHLYTQAGNFNVSLTVTDNAGATNIISSVVTINNNQIPTASFVAYSVTALGELKLLVDAAASTDSDGTIIDYLWDFGDGVTLSTGLVPQAEHIYVNSGTYRVVLTVKDNKSATHTVFQDLLIVDSVAPVITVTSPLANSIITNVGVVTVVGSSNEKLSSATVEVDSGAAIQLPLGADQLSFSGNINLSGTGPKVLTVKARDLAGNESITVVNIIFDFNLPPIAKIKSPQPASGIAPLTSIIDASESTDPEGQTLSYEFDFGDGEKLTSVKAVVGHYFKRSGNYTIQVIVYDSKGSSSVASTNISTFDPILPPNPVDAAPQLDQTAISTIDDSYKFLYSADNPIQTGVLANAIDPVRMTVLRGKVLDQDGIPLSGVIISIQDQTQFGQTLTRADGYFDFATNGGGTYTINYKRNGYFPLQRMIETTAQDINVLQDVVMSRPDSAVNNLEINSPTVQVARGSEVTDNSGTRTSVLLIPSGTSGSIVYSDNSRQALSTLNLRITEYTVGALGPQRMPGVLPASSAYTFAVEVSTDEALAKGADHIEFSKEVPFYVDNFLNFPVGIPVPFGVYEIKTAQWIPQKNGRIIKIMDIQNNLAVLDVLGTGNSASPADLTALGITNEELLKIAEIYPIGKSLWRVSSNRFSPMDLNWFNRYLSSYVAPAVSSPALVSPPPPNDLTCPRLGSIIDIEKQVLREVIPLVGAELTMNYSSERAPGNVKSSQIYIPVTGTSFSSAIMDIKVEVQIAGRIITTQIPLTTNQNYIFDWDGKDAYGRDIFGSTQAKVNINYYFDSDYAFRINPNGSVFARPGGDMLLATVKSRIPSVIKRSHTLTVLKNTTFTYQGIGGWTLSNHMHYDPSERTIFRGDGTKENSQDLGYIVNRYAGTGSMLTYGGDNGPALNAEFYALKGIARFSDGSMLVSDQAGIGNSTILRKISANRDNIFHFGGFKSGASSGDSVTENLDKYSVAINARSIKIAPNDDIYYAEISRIRKIGKDGRVNTISGSHSSAGLFSGDGGPALNARFNGIKDVAIDIDGTIVIADADNQRIRKIGSDGIITTIAGNGTRGFSGDGGPAINAQLNNPEYVAIGRNGYVYVADRDNFRIRAIRPDGIIETVAGNGTGISSNAIIADGVPATQTAMRPFCVETDKDGSIYICDNYIRIRKIDPSGIISTIIGNGNALGQNGGSSQEGILASQARIDGVLGFYSANIAIGDNEVFFAQSATNIAERFSGLHKIRRVSPAYPGQTLSQYSIPSKDGQQIYIFDHRGRHLETRNARTGAVIYKFDYTPDGKLTKVTDFDGLITEIVRDSSGNPTSIIAPHGQVTELTVDANGYLNSVTNLNSETHTMRYDAKGLMLSFSRPKGNSSVFSYDSVGSLTKDQNAAGGFLQLAKTGGFLDQQITLTTAESRVSTNQTRSTSDFLFQINETDAAGLFTQRTLNKQGFTSVFYPDGSFVTTQGLADPRLGVMASYSTSTLKGISGVLTSTTQVNRTLTRSNPNDIFDFAELVNISTNGKLTIVEYDSLTRLERITSPENRVAQNLYDLRGRMIASQTGNLNQASYIFNNQNQLVQSTQGNRVTTMNYNPQGFLSAITNPLSQSVQFSYDNAGRVNVQTYPDGRVIGFNYDANGNMTSVTPPGRPAHEFNFDLADMINNYQAPDVGVPRLTVYNYNLDKQLTSITRPDGQAVNLNYHPTSGRLMSVTTPSGNYNYSYAPVKGVLSSLGSPEGVVSTMTYDGSLVKSISMSGTSTGSVQFNYNTDFLITQSSVNNANAIAFTYTNDNLLKTAGALTLNYDPVNPLLTGSSLGVATDSLGYNSFGELTDYSANISGSSAYAINLVRDDLGRITSRAENIQGATSNYVYGYDNSGRLVSVDKDGQINNYLFDSNSNRIGGAVRGNAISATYDNQDRLLTYGTKSFNYNANGDLVSISDSATGVTASLNYDVMGNLKSYSRPGRVVEYIIDGLDRRVGKKINGVVTQRFVYQNQLQMIAELDASGNVVSRFVYASKSNVPDFMIKAGITYRIFSDNLGSPRLVVNTSSGAIAQRIDYDEFGFVLNDTNPGFIPFGFAGGIYDWDTGLVHFSARQYDPSLGRWLSKDPIGFSGGDTNLYGYVANDPVNFIDPMGLWRWPGAIYDDAMRDARNSGLPGPHNGQQDAYRHCLASCMMTQENGSFLAQLLGDANEKRGDWMHNQESGEKCMDQNNNSKGRDFGRGGGNCSQQCAAAAGSGGLSTYTSGSTPGYWGY